MTGSDTMRQSDPRVGRSERSTTETSVAVELKLDGTGSASVNTGIGFLDHLLTALARHARWDLNLRCNGDLHVDDHHAAEDVALSLGRALDQALGDRAGINRFGDAVVPLDEALTRAVVDLSGRPFADVNLGLRREKLGELATENVGHVLRSFAIGGRLTLHVDTLKGENDHHRAESAFKAVAVALRQATTRSGSSEIPSTKGSL
jgi:imidazoleglycerol-phosphate dehydratase